MNRLVNLSTETRNLINDGIYSLYSVKALCGPKYVLYASNRSFLLNESGKVLGEIQAESDVSVIKAIIYIEDDGTPHSDFKKQTP